VAPVPGSTLSGSTETFQWSANGAGVTEWWLYAGTSVGGKELYDSRSLGTSTSTTVAGLPTDGSTVWVRLWYLTDDWYSVDFTYTAAAGSTNGGTTGGGDTGSFSLSWTAPVARSDGTPMSLAEIDGFRIYYENSSGDYSNSMDVTDGSAQSATVTDVPAGDYYVAMTTYDDAGRESAISAQITKTAQ
jgi:hypothetical protein